ncbi:hypothetical protein KID03_02165 [bacterium]|uniref:Uncharacterized protein n=1 Tax=Candidatus Scatenecus faecavium TaxID=2840915 RepID=A0A9D1K426_9BACT|nr:hypothetical protein [bacterium]HIS83530.1 hypothetical protein [Candidatus Scatenecus faecavium]
MGKTGKYSLAIASRIVTQTQKVKQMQNRSTYRYFQNVQLNNQKADLFLKDENFTAKISKKSIVQEIADRILSNNKNSK